MIRPVFSPLAGRLRERWSGYSQRERQILLGLGLLLGAVLLWLLVDWSSQQRQSLQRSVPRAAAQLAQMQGAAEELAQLRSQALPARLSDTALVAALQAAAEAKGVKLLIQPAGERIQVSGEGGFDSVIDYLAVIQRDHGLRPLRLEILPGGGGVRFEANLAGLPER